MKKIIFVFLIGIIALSGCVLTVDPGAIARPSPNPAAIILGDVSGKNSTVVLSVEEVAKHNSANDCWMIIDSKVYGLASFFGHPGGDSAYLAYCGKDGSTAFHTKDSKGIDHSQQALAMLADYKLGAINQAINTPKANTLDANKQIPPRNGRNNDEKYEDD